MKQVRLIGLIFVLQALGCTIGWSGEAKMVMSDNTIMVTEQPKIDLAKPVDYNVLGDVVADKVEQRVGFLVRSEVGRVLKPSNVTVPGPMPTVAPERVKELEEDNGV